MRWLMLVPLMLLSACVSTAVAVVKAPFQAAGTVVETAVDATTTTQEESDRNRGRALREQEEAEEKARKKAEKQRRRAARDPG